MVNQLRRKFILTAMSALFVIVVILVAAINLLDARERSVQQERISRRLEEGGTFPGNGPKPWEADPPEGSFPRDGNRVTGAPQEIFPGGREEFLQFNREMDTASSKRLLIISIAIGAGALLAMLLLVWLMSGHAVAPVASSMEKQKRFLTDAGHELKTPLSVIKADVDVLEMEGVSNEWTASIKAQADRMDGLIKNMLALSRMEEEFLEPRYEDLDFSALVQQTADHFDVVAESGRHRYEKEIAPGIHVSGDAQGLEQLINVLIDNAMKYSADEGRIFVRLARATQKPQAVLEVSNPVAVMPQGNLDRLFDRFYRSDASRAKSTGGFGIGLSAARAIVNAHGGSIKAVPDGDHTIRFIAKLPCKAAANPIQ